MIYSTHRASLVLPDQEKESLRPDQLSDASNMRMGVVNPKGGSSWYRIKGNLELVNPLLPAGSNKALGWCNYMAGKKLFWANWNSEGDHAIYCYSEENGFQKVLEVDYFTSTMKLSMAYDNGYLVWTSIDIEEPRQINVERGINSYLDVPVEPKYDLPIADWQTYQLHRPPLYPLEVTAAISDVANAIPKPDEGYVKTARQFSYNIEYIDNIESRIANPTETVWNNNITLTIPASEQAFYTNAYVVAIRFYVRIGNDGDWIYFHRLENDGVTYTLSVGELEDIFSIGTPSVTALLGADGIGRFINDLIFADSRLVHAGISTGYDVALPTASTSVVVEDDLAVRKYRAFPPIPTQTDTAIIYYDALGRFIGGTSLGSQSTTFTEVYSVDLDLIKFFDPGIFFSAPWDQIVDFLYPNPSPFVPSRIDLYNMPAIQITPSGTIETRIAIGVLATKPKRRITSFLRTICRPFWIYKDASGNFLPYVGGLGRSSDSVTIDNVVYSFYGIGFDFLSDEPINFSNEQNYFVQVRGYTKFLFTTLFPNYTGDWKFEITDQFGSILISKQQISTFWIVANDNDNPVSNARLSSVGSVDYDFDKYSHIIFDVCLYSQNQDDVPWQLVPQVNWTRAELIAGTPKRYYGPNYVTAESNDMGPENRKAFGVIGTGSNVTNNYAVEITDVPWAGYFASMNLNGGFLEDWDTDTGSNVVIESNPKKNILLTAIRHSERYFLGTEINNIFTFDPQNEAFTQSQLGSIVKIILLAINNNEGNNIYAVCENGAERVYLGRTQQVGTDGNSVMSLSTKVFGSQNVMQLSFGIKNKDQVMQTNYGIAVFVDNKNRALIQLSNNGLDEISMQRGFQSHMRDIGGDPIVGYNPLYKEFIVEGNSDGESFAGLAYNFVQDKYQGRRSFGNNFNGTEVFMWLSSEEAPGQMYGISNGKLYRFDQDGESTVNGSEFRAYASFVSVMDSAENKDYFNIEYLGEGAKSWEVSEITSSNGKQSNISPQEFVKRKDFMQATIKRALPDKYTGIKMDGAWMEFKIIDFDDSEKSLTFVKVGAIISSTNGNR